MRGARHISDSHDRAIEKESGSVGLVRTVAIGRDISWKRQHERIARMSIMSAGQIHWRLMTAVSVVAVVAMLSILLFGPSSAVLLVGGSIALMISIWQPAIPTTATLVIAFTALPDFIPRTVAVGGLSVRLYEITLLIAVVAWSCRRRCRGSDGVALLLMLLLGAGCLVSRLAGHSVTAILADTRLLVLVPLAVFVAGRAWNAEVKPNYVRWLSIVLWVSAVTTLIASTTGLSLGQRQLEASLDLRDAQAATRLVTEATYPAVAVLSACLCLYLLGRLPVASRFALVVPAGLIVLLSFSRNPLLSLAVAAAVAVLVAPAAATLTRALKVAISLLVAAGMAWALSRLDPSGGVAAWFDSQIAGLTTRVLDGLTPDALAQDGSTQYRTAQENPYLLAAIQASPILGHGFGYEYKSGFTGRYFASAEELALASQYAHNFYLWLPVKIGLAGTTAFLLLVVPRILRAFRAGTEASTVALAAAMLGLLVQSTVAPMPIGSPTSVLFGGLLGLVLVEVARRDTPVPKRVAGAVIAGP